MVSIAVLPPYAIAVSCNHSLHHPVLLPRHSTASASSSYHDAAQCAASVTESQYQDDPHSNHQLLQSPSAVSSDLDTANVQQHPGPARRRPPKRLSQEKQVDIASEVISCLIQEAQLPKALAEHVVTALIKGTPGMPSQPKEVCRRVQCLQDLLGVDNAHVALKRCPYLVAYSPSTLAFNFKQWQLFFSVQDSAAHRGPFTQKLQEARTAAVLQRVTKRPQLLCCAVDKSAANVYEIAALLGVQEHQTFAFQAMELCVMSPEAVLNKLMAILRVLNSPQQQDSPQQQQQDTCDAGTTSPISSHTNAAQAAAAAATPAAAPAAAAPLLPAGPVHEFSFEEVQAAARRSHQWLALSQETLEQRLRGMQQELGMPMSLVGAMFLKNPSLLSKRPLTLASKAAALRELPGMRPETAAAMLVVLPTLLNLKPEKLRDRWRQLQAAADTHPAWRKALDSSQPSSLAGMLIRGDGRYARLQQVIAERMQDKVSLSSTLSSLDAQFETKLEKYSLIRQRASQDRRQNDPGGTEVK